MDYRVINRLFGFTCLVLNMKYLAFIVILQGQAKDYHYTKVYGKKIVLAYFNVIIRFQILIKLIIDIFYNQ